MKDFSLGVLAIISLAFIFGDEDEVVADNKSKEYFHSNRCAYKKLSYF